MATLRHGHTSRYKVSPEYCAWLGMKRRCGPTEHGRPYRSRGITVCDRWIYSFDTFLADMGPRPSPLYSLDRIDNDGNYEPSNCRWATKTQQQSNTRRTIMIEMRGETMPAKHWCRRVGLDWSTVRKRIAKGWDLEQAFFAPVDISKSRRKAA